MRRLTITAIASGMLVAVPAQAIEPADYQGVAAALAQYKSAMEKRDLTGVEALFAPDGQIFESGGVEGNFAHRSEAHTSELQSLMRISYAVFCLKKKTQQQQKH